MSQSSATKLISKLRFKVHDRRKFSNPDGPVGRHDKIRKVVTALFKYERLETAYSTADEARGYAERLLSEAIRNGDTHKHTMEMASYWILDAQVIHKLFKVLAPRYKDCKTSYTKLWPIPKVYPGCGVPKCMIELRNNIYPPLGPDTSQKKNLIHNILLEEAKKAYMKEKENNSKKSAEGGVSSKNDSNIIENIQVNASAAGTDTESLKTNETELAGEENLKADSNSKNETEENFKVDSTMEENLDLNKMKIEEEKQVETPSEEKK